MKFHFAYKHNKFNVLLLYGKILYIIDCVLK